MQQFKKTSEQIKSKHTGIKIKQILLNNHVPAQFDYSLIQNSLNRKISKKNRKTEIE